LSDKDNQDLNAGELHVDGEGEYTPPTGEGIKHIPPIDEGGTEESLEDMVDGKTKIQGDDFQVGGDNDIDESDIELPPSEGVEYGAPPEPDEDTDDTAVSLEEAIAEPDNKDIPVNENGAIQASTEGQVIQEQAQTSDNTTAPVVGQNVDEKTGINLDNVIEEQELTQSDKPGFNPADTQDARSDHEVEGGIARNRTTGNQFHSRGMPEGHQVRPDISKPKDVSEMFEISGFTVSFEKKPGQGNVNVEITDHFIDLETAQASINGEKYLMPLPQTGFKIVDIVSGAPTISHHDRVLYEYINNKWRRK